MFTCECLCVIVISRIGAGGKPKYEKIRPYGRKTRLPGTVSTPLQKQQKPEGLDFSRLLGFYGQKEKPRRLYQILRGYVVEVAGFEPAAFWSRTKRATKLRYTSILLETIRGLGPLTC